ncbi:MAG: hypothetical protein AAFY15_03590 [Cyanobacteria bacterium J06648_11]
MVVSSGGGELGFAVRFRVRAAGFRAGVDAAALSALVARSPPVLSCDLLVSARNTSDSFRLTTDASHLSGSVY